MFNARWRCLAPTSDGSLLVFTNTDDDIDIYRCREYFNKHRYIEKIMSGLAQPNEMLNRIITIKKQCKS